jgi:glycosyltransferase involved in cell wall biosynthesis
MRVLQLIDSLNAGGAERVAVNFANSLRPIISESFICSTRAEGVLKSGLSKEVQYLFLNKKSIIDFKAIGKLNSFINLNKIGIIHAHGSSFFLGTIIKILNPKVILIWHEHYGNRNKTPKINKLILKICSWFFSSIIAVNESLKERSESKLLTKNVYILPNYPVINTLLKVTKLKGNDWKRIVCLANLRPDKDHLNLLEAFNELNKLHPDWTLHLVGQFYKDEYYNSITNYIIENNLESFAFIYGSCPDIYNILNQCDIGVLSSKSEGLPVSLLEYGLSKLPVIVTNVGDCNKVISNLDEGIIIESENHKALSEAIQKLIEDVNLRKALAENLHQKIVTTYSESSCINVLIEIYKKHIR